MFVSPIVHSCIYVAVSESVRHRAPTQYLQFYVWQFGFFSHWESSGLLRRDSGGQTVLQGPSLSSLSSHNPPLFCTAAWPPRCWTRPGLRFSLLGLKFWKLCLAVAWIGTKPCLLSFSGAESACLDGSSQMGLKALFGWRGGDPFLTLTSLFP